MPREIQKHEQVIEAFQKVESVCELVEKLPNGEFRNELEMDIILFGRSYRGKQVGPYSRLLEYEPGEIIIEEGTWESSIFYMLVEGKLDASVRDAAGNRKKVGEIPPGATFGEMALLSGTKRTATVAAAMGSPAALVLEFTRPAIRLLRKLPLFAKALDRNYRNYGLTLTLNELKDNSQGDLTPDLVGRLNDAARFAVYEKGHVLFREGDPINRVFYIRNGWVQRVSGLEFSSKAADLLIETDESVGVDFMGAGTCLGLSAVGEVGNWPFTATVSGRTEVAELAVSRLRDDREMSSAVMPFLSAARSREHLPLPPHPQDTRVLTAASREIDTGVADGLNLLVMDMGKCIRCGNCSLACHKVHGHTRLVRRGIHIERPVKPGKALQSVLVPSVCMHCQDPECLTGCPTGAIARFPNGEIDINTKTCIGCGDCATQCPYNAISMIGRSPENGKGAWQLAGNALSSLSMGETKLPPPVTQTEDLLAIKCNLCHETPMNPKRAKKQAYSCEENCPTGALVRVDPKAYFDEVNQAIGLIRRTNTHAVVKNIHKFDLTATIWHILGTIIFVAAAAAAIWATRTYSQDVPISAGSWLTMRWITGITGLGAITWVMMYPVRKQIYRRRAGALRYWMLSHIYLGLAAVALLLVHGGTRTGGVLTTVLMITFDLVIATGIFGAACYWLVPKFMTRIEGEPLLIEDLEERRAELRSEIDLNAGDSALAGPIGRVRKRFLGFRYLLRQFLRKEDLPSMLAEARQEFSDAAGELPRLEGARLMEAVENAATLRRVDALVLLHRVLKIWVAPHVLFTSLMLVLMLLHIAQAVYFNVR